MSENDEKLKSDYELLCGLIRQDSAEKQRKTDLSKIEDIIRRRIPDTVKKNAPGNFYEIYADFQSEYERFKDYLLYNRITGKNIIALGGASVSGKSGFLNELLGESLLPSGSAGLNQIPVYIVTGDKTEATGINIFDAKIPLQPKDIKKLTRGEGTAETEDAPKAADTAAAGHMLKSLFLAAPRCEFSSTAFLETPGCFLPDAAQTVSTEREQAVRGQLNSANYILWFVQAAAGTVPEAEIRFIKTLRKDIPKLIVVSKADEKTLSALKIIISNIKSALDLQGVRYADVLAFTDRISQVRDEKLKEYLEQDAIKLLQQIAAWSEEIYDAPFARNFMLIFVACKKYYEYGLDEENRRISALKAVVAQLAARDIGGEILDPLHLMIKKAQHRAGELKDLRKKLKNLQDEFFTEIKFVADSAGISMPEPSEIDQLKDKVSDPLQLLGDYKKEKGIKTDPSLAVMLRDMFEGIEPVITCAPGGSEYRKELAGVIAEVCSIQPEDIRINDVYRNTKEYAELLDKTGGIAPEDIHVNDVYKNTKEFAGLLAKAVVASPEDIRINDVYKNTKEYAELLAKISEV